MTRNDCRLRGDEDDGDDWKGGLELLGRWTLDSALRFLGICENPFLWTCFCSGVFVLFGPWIPRLFLRRITTIRGKAIQLTTLSHAV
jgi:hypothetical protein